MRAGPCERRRVCCPTVRRAARKRYAARQGAAVWLPQPATGVRCAPCRVGARRAPAPPVRPALMPPPSPCRAAPASAVQACASFVCQVPPLPLPLARSAAPVPYRRRRAAPHGGHTPPARASQRAGLWQAAGSFGVKSPLLPPPVPRAWGCGLPPVCPLPSPAASAPCGAAAVGPPRRGAAAKNRAHGKQCRRRPSVRRAVPCRRRRARTIFPERRRRRAPAGDEGTRGTSPAPQAPGFR